MQSNIWRTQQACEPDTGKAFRSCSCSWQKSHDTAGSSFCGRWPALASLAYSWHLPCCHKGQWGCFHIPCRSYKLHFDQRLQMTSWSKVRSTKHRTFWHHAQSPAKVPVPGRNVLVCKPWCDIKHDDGTLTMDIVSITQPSKLFLTSRVPAVEA